MAPRDAGHSLRLDTTTSSAESHQSEPTPRRSRGYSQRTHFFNRNISKRNGDSSPLERSSFPIELVESLQPEQALQSQASPKVSFSVNNEIYKNNDVTYRYTPDDEEEDGKKKFITSSRASELLPNYSTLAARYVARDQIRKRLKKTIDTVVDFILRRKHPPPSKGGRRIPIEVVKNRAPIIDERTDRPHIKNNITSSIYTVYNFLPRQLIYQFSKIANV